VGELEGYEEAVEESPMEPARCERVLAELERVREEHEPEVRYYPLRHPCRPPTADIRPAADICRRWAV